MSLIHIIPEYVNQVQLQPSVLTVSRVKTEAPTVIKSELPNSEMMEISVDSSESKEKIIPDIKDIDIVWHPLCKYSIKSETIPENILESKHSEYVETQVLVKGENSSFIKTENITQSENLNKTEDISDGKENRGTGQGVVEVQGTNEHVSALDSLETNKQLVLNFSKDLNVISIRRRKAKHSEKTDFAKYYKAVASSSWEKDKEEVKIIEAHVIPFCCEKCTFVSKNYTNFKLHELSHKTKAEMDDQDLKYRCDKCDYKTYRHENFKRHKLKHLKPGESQYFHCYHCSYKSNRKEILKRHIFRHFKKEEIEFHCYICNFMTLNRESIIEHIKKHSKVQIKSKINEGS